MDNCKEQIRCLISNVYDLQKLRIASGNRLCQSFYVQIGIDPSIKLSDDKNDEKAKNLISLLRLEYDRITDGVILNGVSIKKQIKALQGKENDGLQWIKTEMDYKLVDSYMLLLKAEEESIKVLDAYVKKHPLWDNFFADIKGCGTLMSAMCIAYLDIRKARYVSSFYCYAGLDTVQDEDKDGNKLFLTQDGTYRKVREKFIYIDRTNGKQYFGKVKKTDEFDSEGNQIILSDEGAYLDCELAMQDGQIVYEDLDGNEYIGEVVVSEHGRRKGDTQMVEYIDKNGKKQMKRGITYNPILKSKLMGVLSGCLLKAKDPTYSTIYYDYRKRLDNSSYHKDKSLGQKNMMALRYMIKQFLRNLWTTWRVLEGLEVNYPYEVEKLGNKPHKYNQYQCEMADNYNK